MRKLLLLLGVMLLSLQLIYAQSRNLTGTVTDDRGNPLPNVSVQVKGSSVGTVTGSDGTFSLSVPANARSLVFSSVGQGTQEINIGANASFQVAMKAADRSLDEVVVVGYGTQRRREVTSAIGKIDAEPIANLVTPSVDRQLGGRTAGVQVTNSTGLVNQAPRIRVRGVNSINGSRSPLIVLDGVPIVDGNFSGVANTNALADINPADIESIEVLKDGSATAIYGSRASNGVLLITTKKGRSGRSNVTYSTTVGISNPYKRFDLLNAQEFVTIANEKFAATGTAPQARMNAENTNTDWQDYVYRQNAFAQTHNLSIDGGNDRSTYFFSANYTDQEGMIITNKVKRYAIRANLDHRVNNWLRFSNNLTLSRTEDNDQNNGGNALSGAVANALRALPNVRVFNPAATDFNGFNVSRDGASLGLDSNLRAIENNYTNIGFVLNKNRYRSIKQRILNNFSVEIKPVSWITLTSKFGIDYLTGTDFQSLDPRHGDGRGSRGYVFNQSINNLRWVWQNYANAVRRFGDHGLNLTLGTESQNENQNSFNGQGQNFADIFFQQQSLISGSYVTQLSGGGYSEGPGFVSYFGRVGYDYKNKYFLQGSVRRDGLSRFAPDRRFGTFPGVSAGWRVSEEGFWNNLGINFISDLKLRGSWARVGNDQIAGGLFPFLSQYGLRPYGAVSGSAIGVVGNSNLTWETQDKLNIGADISFLNDRLTFTFDWYKNNNNNLVLAAPLPVSFGVPGNSIFQNIGNMESRGIELSLGGQVLNKGDFNWDFNLNFTTVNNEVKSLYLNQDNNVSNYNILRVGQPINALYGYRFAGVNSANGNPMYFKADGTLIQGNIATSSYFNVVKPDDATLGAANTLAGTDRTILGNVLPTWFGGFNNSLRYKGFSLDMLWRFSGGNKIFNLTRQEALLNQAFQNNGREILERWQKPGDVTNVPRLWYGRDNFTNLQQQATDRFVENGDFLRLDNLQLGYAFNRQGLSNLTNGAVKSLRLFVQGQNLLLITNYSGIDPENITEGGIDNNTVPQPRIISFGLNLGL